MADYRLLGRLDEGGIGVVYLARSPRGRMVAVKLAEERNGGNGPYPSTIAVYVALTLLRLLVVPTVVATAPYVSRLSAMQQARREA
ncbi:hypothetical protein ABZ686_15495 [Streptomyces sp. NPDC006992]|uniref:hypothetical protein n=1 Tax=Streptomyces sp. NPDC006992 TaxID=3155601 RepID=UPI0033E2DD08